jgi:hypothetical protein
MIPLKKTGVILIYTSTMFQKAYDFPTFLQGGREFFPIENPKIRSALLNFK